MGFQYKPTEFMLPTSRYDKNKADRAVAFIQNLCHTKGKWAGKRFILLPWQEQIIRDLFGVVKEDGKRQFLTAYVEIPKKTESRSLRRLLRYTCFSPTMSRRLKSTGRLVTGSKPPLYSMWRNKWFKCLRHCINALRLPPPTSVS